MMTMPLRMVFLTAWALSAEALPLTFFSYGGSSLWGFTLLLFIFLRFDAGRNRYSR